MSTYNVFHIKMDHNAFIRIYGNVCHKAIIIAGK